MNIPYHCEQCGKLVTERYGSGRFCSRSCSNTWVALNQSDDAKKRKTEKGKNNLTGLHPEKICPSCGKSHRYNQNELCLECREAKRNLYKTELEQEASRSNLTVLEYERAKQGVRLNKRCKVCGIELLSAYHNTHFCGEDYIICERCGDKEYIVNRKQLRDFTDSELDDMKVDLNHRIIIPDRMPYVYHWCRSCRCSDEGRILKRKYRDLISPPSTYSYLSPIIIVNDNTFRLRSSYELIYAWYLYLKGVDFKYEPFYLRFKNGRAYLPDFVIDNEIYEVKGDVEGDRDKIEQTRELSIENGYEYRLIDPDEIAKCKLYLYDKDIPIDRVIDTIREYKLQNLDFIIDFSRF